MKGLFALAVGVSLAGSALAHTVSIGYENAGPGALRFWYGTYHGNDGINFEGSFTLVGINGNTFPSTTVSFNLSTFTKPAGLIDGTTNFYANGSVLSATPYPLTVLKWQGVTFTGLAAGDYRFTYNPKVNPTATWAPINPAVNSSTVSVTVAQLIAAPNAVAGSDITVNQGDLVTLDGSASTDGNTPALSLTYSWTQISGPAAVSLSGANTATPSFTAPSAPAVPSTGAAMVFKLTVSNGASSSPGTDTVTVNVRGNSPPIANAGPNQTVGAGANCTALVTLNGSGSDSDGTVVSYSWSGAFGTASGASPTVTLPKGPNTIVLTVTDNQGATGTSQVVVTVADLTPPAIITPASSLLVESDGAGNASALSAWLASHGGASATDNCGSVTWSNNYNGLTAGCGTTGSATVVFTATDGSGLSSTTTATFTIADSMAPTIVTAAAGQTVESDGAGNTAALGAWLANHGGASATDTGSAVTWSNNFTAITAACGTTGAATVTFTATDACGNKSTTTATFKIVDTTAPVIASAATSQTVESDGAGNTAALGAWLANHGGASATDTGSAVTWSNNFTAITPACGATGATTVTFTAADACGNKSTTTATFTIVDTTAPVIASAATSQTVESDGAGNTAALGAWLANHGGASATDVGSAVTWSNDFTAITPACGATGATTVTFTAADACGNKSTTTATFKIVDTTKPVMVAAVNKTVESDGAGNTAALGAWLASNGGASATDVGSAVTWSNNFTAITAACGSTGAATVTFTATDACGNASTTSATFTIVDTTKPTIASNVHDISPNIKPDAFVVTSTDIGGGATPSIVKVTATRVNPQGKLQDFTSAYQHTVTGNKLVIDITGGVGTVWTIYGSAVDACGNTTTATYVVNVVNPTLTK